MKNPGIETLIVFIGSNNCLGAVTRLQVKWSDEGFNELKRKGAFNVWRPSHFKSELQELASAVRTINARHVIWATVPHVTIAPIARGLGQKVRPGSRYFPYYSRPWIDERRFNPREDPHLTENQARAIDSAIDQYNDAIVAQVATARKDGLDWLVLDAAGLLDRLASRRYLLDPQARPYWWTPYELPPELTSLVPPIDSQFLGGNSTGRTRGGLFSLDGIHPTTVGYAIVAQEFINIMCQSGVNFVAGDGKTRRQSPVRLDFARSVKLDTLVKSPPPSLDSDLGLLEWLDQTADLFGRLNPFR